jgi:outer membrane protein OmpA-like peptidoglycan-associated protein
MRTSLVLSLLSISLISVGVVNAQAAPFYNPSNVGAGVYTPEPIRSPNAIQVPSTTAKDINRTIGCPGRQLLDKGCAIEDADQDTVEDWTDKCPNTPAGMKVNALGCEIDTHPVVASASSSAPDGPIVVLGDVNFDFDKATLKPSADEKIDQAVAHVNKMAGEKFELKGYTDSVGSDDYNLKLSQSRADAVRDAMIKKGAPADRITATGYGEASPVASNSTEEGRAENRRVELWGVKN